MSMDGTRRAPRLALIALTVAATVSAQSAPRSVTYPGRVMGTYANVTIVTADSTASVPLAALAHATLHRVDSLMSNWSTTSEVARINRVGTKPTVVEPEVALVIDSSLAVARGSDGAFDITVEPLVRLWGFIGGPRRVPSDAEIRATLPRVGVHHLRYDRTTRTIAFDRDSVRIDLGGIAKGYAVERAARDLAAAGVTNALVNLTGNMQALGAAPGAAAWRIGIRDPRDRMPYFAKLTISNEGISTSGQYEQFIAANGHTYGHILNPRTGWPVDGLISVTVVSPSAFTCDAWDTPCFVLGLERAKQLAKRRADLGVVLVQPGTSGIDTVWVESNLRERFSLEPAADSLFRVKYF